MFKNALPVPLIKQGEPSLETCKELTDIQLKSIASFINTLKTDQKNFEIPEEVSKYASDQFVSQR